MVLFLLLQQRRGAARLTSICHHRFMPATRTRRGSAVPRPQPNYTAWQCSANKPLAPTPSPSPHTPTPSALRLTLDAARPPLRATHRRQLLCSTPSEKFHSRSPQSSSVSAALRSSLGLSAVLGFLLHASPTPVFLSLSLFFPSSSSSTTITTVPLPHTFLPTLSLLPPPLCSPSEASHPSPPPLAS